MPDLAIASPTAPPFDPGAALTALRQKPAAPKPDPVAAALPSAAPPPAAGDDALRAAREAMDEFHKAAPQPRQSDPAEAWGSMAMAVAALGGLLTHTPLTTAFNAMGGVLNAYKQNDQAKAQQEFEHWKVAHEAAGKLADMEMKAYGEILKSTDPHRQLAALQAQAAAFKNQAILDATNRGDHEEAMRLITGHANAVSGMQKIEMLQDPKNDNQLYLMRSSKDGTVTFTKPDGAPYEPGGATKISKGAGSPQAPRTPEERDSAAAQAATGMPINQIVPGYGQGASEVRREIRADAVKKIMADTGMSATEAGVELANRSIDFGGVKRSTGQLSTMLGATRQAVSQLDFNIEQTKKEMAKLPSTDISPLINAIVRQEEKWTGDPAYSSLYYFMHATAMESARILSAGQASVAQLHQGAAEEAKKWADIGMTPASFDSVAKAMADEGHYRIKTYEDAMSAQRVTTPGQQPAAATSPAAPHQQQFVEGKIYTDAKGNKARFIGGKWEPVP